MDLGVTAARDARATAGPPARAARRADAARRHLEHALELAGEGLPGEFVVPIRARGRRWRSRAATREARRQVDAAFAAVGDDTIRSTRRRSTGSACGPRPTSPSARAGSPA